MEEQKLIDGIEPPPAPVSSREFVEQALIAYCENSPIPHQPAELSAAQIAKHFRRGMNGYDLARALDDCEGWVVDADTVEQLDGVDQAVSQALREARKAWALQWNIQPPYPIGTRVTTSYGRWRMRGVIANISTWEAASYLVKEDGCNDPGRHVQVKFEDAVMLVEPEVVAS